MCIYCEEDRLYTNRNGNTIEIHPRMGLAVTVYDDEMYRCSTIFPIDYCPMCGRKLQEQNI